MTSDRYGHVLSLHEFASLHPHKPASPPISDTSVPPEAFPGWTVVPEDLWYSWIDEPFQWWQRTETHLRQNQYRAAGNELLKIESWLRMAASQARPRTQTALEDATAALTTMASSLMNREPVSLSEFREIAVRSNFALADWHCHKSREKLEHSSPRESAKNLQAATSYLKQASTGSNYRLGEHIQKIHEAWFDWGPEDRISVNLKTDLMKVRDELRRMTSVLPFLKTLN